MKHYYFYLLPVLVLLSCSQPKPPVPQDKMEAVLLDVELAEVYSGLVPKDSTKPIVQKNIDSLGQFYQSIFAHHHITRADFDTSLVWYRAHPVLLDTMYAHILPKLERMGHAGGKE